MSNSLHDWTAMLSDKEVLSFWNEARTNIPKYPALFKKDVHAVEDLGITADMVKAAIDRAGRRPAFVVRVVESIVLLAIGLAIGATSAGWPSIVEWFR